MASLTGQTVASTYPILLKIETSPLNTVFKTVEAGDGTDSALQLATTGIKSQGTFESTGAAVVGGAITVTGLSTLNAGATITGAVTVTGAATVSTTLGVTGVLTATGGVVGALTGAVTGNTAGVHTGAVVGNVTGNTAGVHTGAVTGNVTGNATGSSGSCTGNSATATALATARDIQVSGAVTGTASFNGSANINIVTTLVAQAVPAGSVFNFAASAAPAGYLECSGAAVSRTTYSALFAVTSTTFGVGDGSTTFNLPDLRGEFVRGFDNSRGVDTGRVFASAQAQDYLSHSHSPLLVGSSQESGGNAGTLILTAGTPDTGIKTNASGSTGSSGGTETRPRNIALIYCIKT